MALHAPSARRDAWAVRAWSARARGGRAGSVAPGAATYVGLVTKPLRDLDSRRCRTEGDQHLGGLSDSVRPPAWRACSRGGTMSRPKSEAEYLARLVPPSVAALSRRSMLRGGLGAG